MESISNHKVSESNRVMFESNRRCDSNRDWIESRFAFAHHWFFTDDLWLYSL